jgi:hypothetical protein
MPATEINTFASVAKPIEQALCGLAEVSINMSFKDM